MAAYSRLHGRWVTSGGPTGATNPVPEDERCDGRAWGVFPNSGKNETSRLKTAALAVMRDRTLGMLKLQPGEYLLDDTFNVSTPDVITWPHGIHAPGAVFKSTFNDPAKDVISFTPASNKGHKFFSLSGFKVQGQGKANNKERHLLHLSCPVTGMYIWNFALNDVYLENSGAGDGLRIEGNIFEGALFDVISRLNKLNGGSLGGHASGGIFSSVSAYGCVWGENDDQGLQLVNNSNDLRVFGGYTLLNANYGFHATNGVRLIMGMGAENNHMSAASFDATQGRGGFVVNNFGRLVACTGTCGSGFKQTHMLRTNLVGVVTVEHCVMSGTGTFPIYISGGSGMLDRRAMANAARDVTEGTAVGVICEEGRARPLRTSPTNGATVTIPGWAGDMTINLTHGATIAGATLALPTTNIFQGMRRTFRATSEITAVTWTSGGTHSDLPTSITAGMRFTAEYDAVNTTWYRIA